LHTPDVIVTDGEPLMQINVYDRLVVVTRRRGRHWVSHPVSPDALAQELARVPQASGLLPPGTLASGRLQGDTFLVVGDRGRVITLATPDRAYTIPIPPLVVAGCGTDYRVWALPDDGPLLNDATILQVAPFPNCYRDGRICWGNVDGRPAAGPLIRKVLKLFLEESLFNAHVADGKSKKYPVSILAQWAALHKKKAEIYPIDDLVSTGLTLGWLAKGGPWS
jgi:hypothetical protein